MKRGFADGKSKLALLISTCFIAGYDVATHFGCASRESKNKNFPIYLFTYLIQTLRCINKLTKVDSFLDFLQLFEKRSKYV